MTVPPELILIKCYEISTGCAIFTVSPLLANIDTCSFHAIVLRCNETNDVMNKMFV